MSRALDLHPAYLYGIFAGFVAARGESLTEEHEAKSVIFGAIALSVLGIACWFGWGALDPTAHGPHRTWAVIIISTTLFSVFSLAAEGLVFALIPLEFLDGGRVREWRLKVWLLMELVAAAFFIYVLILHGESKIRSFSELIRPAVFFAIFGAASFAFWGYFRWDGRPTRSRPETAAAGSSAELPEGVTGAPFAPAAPED